MQHKITIEREGRVVLSEKFELLSTAAWYAQQNSRQYDICRMYESIQDSCKKDQDTLLFEWQEEKNEWDGR